MYRHSNDKETKHIAEMPLRQETVLFYMIDRFAILLTRSATKRSKRVSAYLHLQLLLSVVATLVSSVVFSQTEVRDIEGDIHLTLDESPYVLVGSLYLNAYDADVTSQCTIAREKLTIEPGVVLDLGNAGVILNGGVLEVDGATLVGTGSSEIEVGDRALCGETVHGHASLTNAEVTVRRLMTIEGASLSLSGSSVQAIVLLNGQTHTLAGNELKGWVYLNRAPDMFRGNTVVKGAYRLSTLYESQRTLGVVDGIGRYELTNSLYRNAYDADVTSQCTIAREKLTIEPGVVLDLGNAGVILNGGVLEVDGATLVGTGSSEIEVGDRALCGETVHGHASLTNAEVTVRRLMTIEGASLSLSGSSVQAIVLLNGQTHTLAGNELKGWVYLNRAPDMFRGNTVVKGAYRLSTLYESQRTLGVVDGIGRYELTNSLYRNAYDADVTSQCTIAREKLTIEPGVVLDLGNAGVVLNGGVLEVDGATLVGTGSSEIEVGDRALCGETAHGHASLTDAEVTVGRLETIEGASVSLSGSSVQAIVLLNGQTHTLAGNELKGWVYLNRAPDMFRGNTVVKGAYRLSTLHESQRTLRVVDGIGRYELTNSLYRNAYDADATSQCTIARQKLTIEPGVVLDLGNAGVVLNGGVLEVDGATLVGTGSSEIEVGDRALCGETVHGHASLTNAEVTVGRLETIEGASLTVSNSILRVRIDSRDNARLSITNSDLLANGTIRSTSSQVVVANGNYWGCATGPNTEGCVGYTGNVDADDWVGFRIHDEIRSVSLELVDIHAYQDIGGGVLNSLGTLTLALPVQVPLAATEIRIRFRVLGEAGSVLSNRNFNLGMDNGLLRASQGFENLSTNDNGFLIATVDIAPSFGESAAQVWLGLYAHTDSAGEWGSGWGQVLAEFLTFFTTMETRDILPVGAVVAADQVFTRDQLRSVEEALASAPHGYIDFADLESILPRGHARRAISSRIAGVISDELGGIVRSFSDAASVTYEGSRSVVQLIVPSERLRGMLEDGNAPSVVFTTKNGATFLSLLRITESIYGTELSAWCWLRPLAYRA